MKFIFNFLSQLNSDSGDFSWIFLVIFGADVQAEDEDIWCRFKLKHYWQTATEISETME